MVLSPLTFLLCRPNVHLFIHRSNFFFLFFLGEILESNLIVSLELEQENLLFGKLWHHAKQVLINEIST